MKTIQELEKMTDDELRVMLAELDGWEFCEKARTKRRKPLPWTIPHCRHPKHTQGIWRIRARLTDYTRDLDACHAVVHALLPHQQEDVAIRINDMTRKEYMTRAQSLAASMFAKPRVVTIALILTLQAQ